MSDTVGSGVQEQDTDYKYEDMVQAFIDRGIASANAMSRQASDAGAAITSQLVALGTMHQVWMSSFIQVMPAITASAIDQINSSGAVSQLMNQVLGGRLSNSANPSIPSSQGSLTPTVPNVTGPGSGGSSITLPKGTTITVPAA